MWKNPKKAKKEWKEISLCGDCWLSVFQFIGPYELGLKFALLSDRFDHLVDEHFKTKKWAMGFLEIRLSSRGKRAVIVNNFGDGQRSFYPIPQKPLPSNIVGFESIRISYVDQHVVQFLHRIRRLFDSVPTNLYIATAALAETVYRLKHFVRSCEAIRQHILPLLRANVRALFLSSPIFDRLLKFSPSFLVDCPSLGTIDSYQVFPYFNDINSAIVSRGRAVGQWLAIPRPDGLPKVLNCGCSPRRMGQLKESFLNASSSANFILFLAPTPSSSLSPFELTNDGTGERMTLKQIATDRFLLVRCPIVRDEAQWAEWEEAAIKWEWTDQWNCIVIAFSDRDGIGQNLHLSLPDDAGSSNV